MLLLALEKLGVERGDACYVGDMHIDVETAAAAGVRFIGVASGDESEAQLIASGAKVVAADIAAVLPLVES